MNLIREIKELIWWAIKQILILLALLAGAAAAPLILAALPQLLLFLNPTGDFGWLAAAFSMLSPLAAAVWMTVLCHWHSIRCWQKTGQDLSWWREAHGGYGYTIGKSTLFMLLGFFGSFGCEFAFSTFFPFPRDINRVGAEHIWFALFPFAAFAPVILLLLKRRNFSERPDYAPAGENYSSLSVNDYGEFLAEARFGYQNDPNFSFASWVAKRRALPLPEQVTKAVGEMDGQQIIKIAKQGPEAAELVGQALEDHFKARAAAYREAARQMQDEE